MPVKDRRSSLRVELEGRARIRTDRDLFEGHCVDLGLHGIAIQSTRAVRPGEAVSLEAVVQGQHLHMEATLVRRQRHGGDYVLGFAFVELDLDTQRRIEHLLFERLDGSPQGDLMRAFVAHADRVPPPATRDDAGDRTMVVAGELVPVISGHTQIVHVDMLPRVEHTVIAPPPTRGETVIAPIQSLSGALPEPLPEASPPEETAGVPDDTWLEDEMDTAQFRLLEAAQAREAAEQELARLEPDAPVPEDTVVVGGFAVAQPEPTATEDDTARPFRERTLVSSDGPEPSPRERTVVTSDGPEPSPRERTVVTSDGPERTLAERTAMYDAGTTTPVPRTPTTALHVGLDLGSTVTAPTEPLVRRRPEPSDPRSDPTPERLAERTLPFLRDFVFGPLREPVPSGPRSEPTEHTTITAGGLPGALAPDSDALALRPAARALLDATALLRRPASAVRSGPRVIVSGPHRTYRRVAPTPWNRR